MGYYLKEELKEFSLEVEELDLRRKSFASDAIEVDPELRGLELNLCPIRARNRLIAQKCIIKCQNKLNADPHRTSEQKISSLAAASAKLSRWSTLVARHQGRLDSLSVYGGDYLIPINDPVDISPFPSVAKAKARRRITPHDESYDEDHPAAKRRREKNMKNIGILGAQDNMSIA